MKTIQIPIYQPSDSYEPQVGFVGPSYRDGGINYTLSETLADYQALTEAYLTLASMGQDKVLTERMIELAARFRGKAKWWTKVNGNVAHPAGETKVGIEALCTMADQLDKALTKRRAA